MYLENVRFNLASSTCGNVLLVFPKLVVQDRLIMVCKSFWVYEPTEVATFKILNVEVDLRFTPYQQKRNWYYTPEKGLGSVPGEVSLEVVYYSIIPDWKPPDFDYIRNTQFNFVQDLEREMGIEV